MEETGYAAGADADECGEDEKAGFAGDDGPGEEANRAGEGGEG